MHKMLHNSAIAIRIRLMIASINRFVDEPRMMNQVRSSNSSSRATCLKDKKLSAKPPNIDIIPNTPIPHRLLPSLQLGCFIQLEPVNPRTISIRFERDTRRTDSLPNTFCRNIRLFSRPSTPLVIPFPFGGRTNLRRAALWGNQSGVDEK